MKDEDQIPASLNKKYTEMILDFVLYDVENNQALQNFELVKNNTHCIFSKRAVLWGCRDYNNALSLEGNVIRYVACQKKLSSSSRTFLQGIYITLSVIGASLSEPHIDHDNVPRRGECLYLAACNVCPPQCSREHAYSINNT